MLNVLVGTNIKFSYAPFQPMTAGGGFIKWGWI